MFVKTEYTKMDEGRKFIYQLEDQGLIQEVKEDLYDTHTLEFTFKPTPGNDRQVRHLIKKRSDIIRY